MSSKKINLIIVILSTVFSLIFAEFILRLTLPDPIVYMVKDPILGYRAIPGVLDYDENGYRNKMDTKNIDIIAIGDSQTDGLYAKEYESWPHVLGRKINKKVYQMALGQSGFPQYFYRLKKAIEMNPDLIIYGFYLGNDLFDTYKTVYELDYWKDYRKNKDNQNDKILSEEKKFKQIRESIISGAADNGMKKKLFKFRLFLRDHSKLYALIGDSTRKLREKFGLAKNYNKKRKELNELAKKNQKDVYLVGDEGVETILSPSYRLTTVDLSKAEIQEAFEIAKIMILKTQEELNKKNIDFLLLIIPTKERVYGEYFKRNNRIITDSLENILKKEDDVIKKTINFCINNNIKYYDVTPDLRDALMARNRIYYNSLDGHPTASGYAVIADSVAKYLNNVKINIASSSLESLISSSTKYMAN